MAEQPDNFDLKKCLVDKSVDAYVLGLETINRISVRYRLEASCSLFCNAWELLLKAKIVEDAGGSEDAICRARSRKKVRETLSLRECLKQVIPNENDPMRRNIERTTELRDDAVHLVIPYIPSDIIGLLQASVVNYHRKLHEWFGTSLSDRLPIGMMSIVYDLSPELHGLTDNRLRRNLGPDAAEFLTTYCASLRQEFDQLQRPREFSVTIDYRVLLTSKSGEADMELSSGPADGPVTKVVEVAKDPSNTHPFRLKEVIEQVKAELPGALMNQYDFRCISKVYPIKNRPEYYYKGKVPNSPSQYSRVFVEWVVDQYRRDADFFLKTRAKAKGGV